MPIPDTSAIRSEPAREAVPGRPSVGPTAARWALAAGGGAFVLFRLARASLAPRRERAGRTVERTVTIDKPPEDLYRFWRQPENLPRFMGRVRAVSAVGPDRTRWVAAAPGGRPVVWEAELAEARANERIAWRTLPGAPVAHAGHVRFRRAPQGRGTEVTLRLDYRAPGGRLSDLAARVFGADPESVVREDLRRFKQLMEAGEVPTTAGQPHAGARGAEARR